MIPSADSLLEGSRDCAAKDMTLWRPKRCKTVIEPWRKSPGECSHSVIVYGSRLKRLEQAKSFASATRIVVERRDAVARSLLSVVERRDASNFVLTTTSFRDDPLNLLFVSRNLPRDL
jgi:hypothetical protein